MVEVNVEPDGSTTFEGAADDAGGAEGAEEGFDEEIPLMEEVVATGVDPAIYLLVAFVVGAALYFLYLRKQRSNEEDYFSSYEKFNIKLPAEVDEYYSVKEKCMKAGWLPDKPAVGPEKANPNGPHRVMAQSLMKRAIGDIPIVTFIQKESAGMNKLYSQSMCSVSQWRAYQTAEAMVSTEVDEVRAEADEIEPGWSQVIWRQAMQYHTMLKQKHELEQKAAADTAAKKMEIEQRVNAAKAQIQSKEDEKEAAERIARELVEAEDKEKNSGSKSFGMKKGFLEKKKK